SEWDLSVEQAWNFWVSYGGMYPLQADLEEGNYQLNDLLVKLIWQMIVELALKIIVREMVIFGATLFALAELSACMYEYEDHLENLNKDMKDVLKCDLDIASNMYTTCIFEAFQVVDGKTIMEKEYKVEFDPPNEMHYILKRWTREKTQKLMQQDATKILPPKEQTTIAIPEDYSHITGLKKKVELVDLHVMHLLV
ncbi:hypothetical protein ACJX0J_027434, partial [Zea mays]